jgi:hypothetical protein
MNYEQALKDIKRKRKELAKAEAAFRKIEAEHMFTVGKTNNKGLNTRVKVLKNNEKFIFTNTNTGHTVTTLRYPNSYGERKVYEIVNGKQQLVMGGTRVSINQIKEYTMSK